MPVGLVGRRFAYGSQFSLVVFEDPAVILSQYIEPDTGRLVIRHPVRSIAMRLLAPANVKVRHQDRILVLGRFGVGTHVIDLPIPIQNTVSFEDEFGWSYNFSPAAG